MSGYAGGILSRHFGEIRDVRREEEVAKKFRTHVGWGRERVFEVINIRNESGEKPNGKKSDREIR